MNVKTFRHVHSPQWDPRRWIVDIVLANTVHTHISLNDDLAQTSIKEFNNTLHCHNENKGGIKLILVEKLLVSLHIVKHDIINNTQSKVTLS